MTHTVFLMIWNVLGSEGLGGQQLGAVVVTLYKFKLANGLAVFIQYNTITNLYSTLGGVPSSYQLHFTWMFTILFTRLMA